MTLPQGPVPTLVLVAAVALAGIWFTSHRGHAAAPTNSIPESSDTDLNRPALVNQTIGEEPTIFGGDGYQRSAIVKNADLVPGELVVRFSSGASAAQRFTVLREAGAQRVQRLLLQGLELVRIDRGRNLRAVQHALARSPLVKYAEPNFVYRAASAPNDTSYAKQWGLENTGQVVAGERGTSGADISAPEGWSTTTGSRDVIVAVVDTGVAYDHPDIAPNVWRNPNEQDDGQDSDGNGFPDDIHGWDFVSRDADPLDLNGHGTHVAGIVAARGNNELGITGVAWRTSIMPVRALDVHGVGTSSNIAAAFAYAARNGAHVVNASFGGPRESSAVRDAIREAPQTLFVTAAGNDGHDNDTRPLYPCNYRLDNIVCVAATDQDDALVASSNYGSESVHLGAPGVRILSTVPSFVTAYRDNFERALAGRWTTGGRNNTWGRAEDSSGFYLSDSPNANYRPDTDSWIRTSGWANLSELRGCHLNYAVRLDIEHGHDALHAGASSDCTYWSTIGMSTGSTGGHWYAMSDDLSAFDGGPVQIRFRFISTSQQTTRTGADVSDVRVRCLPSTYAKANLGFASGTSMSAPHITGAAALLFSVAPDATVVQVKDALLSGVDPLPELAGKTVTEGRLNVARSLTQITREGPALERYGLSRPPWRR